MGLVGGLVWVNNYSKKQCRSIFWRMRAAVKKAVKNRGLGKQQLKFQYDPWSYALNFDDGACSVGEEEIASHKAKALEGFSENTTRVYYLLWVET